jgi:hypothetical protein
MIPMNLEPQARATAPLLPPVPAALPSLVDGMVLRHLTTASQVASVLHLRDEIDLSVHAAAGRQFVELEKKETSAASCSGSSLQVRP